MFCAPDDCSHLRVVSMKSGLEGRNNVIEVDGVFEAEFGVSMKSGLEGRNNAGSAAGRGGLECVSMKSGLEGRNNRQ